MKNMPNMPATISAWMTFAPETLRERNRRSGISGFSIRDWRKTNAAIRAAEIAPRIIVCGSVQPFSEIWRML